MIAGDIITVSLPKGSVLEVTTAASSAGTVQLVEGDATNVVHRIVTMAASKTYRLGPYESATTHKIKCTAGTVTYTQDDVVSVVGLSIDGESSVHGNIFLSGIKNNTLYWGGVIGTTDYDPSNDTVVDVGGGGLIYAKDTCFFDSKGVPLAPIHTATLPSCGGAQTVDVESTISAYGTWAHVPSYYDVKWYLDDAVVHEDSVTADGSAVYTYTEAGTGKLAVRGRNDFGYTTEANFGGVSQDAEGFVESNTFNVAEP